jgi:hypothetical protein
MGGDNPLTSRAPDTLLENCCQITREEISELLTHGYTFPSKYKANFLENFMYRGMPTPSSLSLVFEMTNKKIMKLSRFGLGLWNLGSSNKLEVSQYKGKNDPSSPGG